MSYMIEVYDRPPEAPNREAALMGCVADFGGRLDYREPPTACGLGGICLTFEFGDLERAKAAAESLRRKGEHVEGPMEYGP